MHLHIFTTYILGTYITSRQVYKIKPTAFFNESTVFCFLRQNLNIPQKGLKKL